VSLGGCKSGDESGGGPVEGKSLVRATAVVNIPATINQNTLSWWIPASKILNAVPKWFPAISARRQTPESTFGSTFAQKDSTGSTL